MAITWADCRQVRGGWNRPNTERGAGCLHERLQHHLIEEQGGKTEQWFDWRNGLAMSGEWSLWNWTAQEQAYHTPRAIHKIVTHGGRLHAPESCLALSPSWLSMSNSSHIMTLRHLTNEWKSSELELSNLLTCPCCVYLHRVLVVGKQSVLPQLVMLAPIFSAVGSCRFMTVKFPFSDQSSYVCIESTCVLGLVCLEHITVKKS